MLFSHIGLQTYLAATINLINFILTRKKNLPVDWVRSKPVPVSGPSLILLKKAPHPNAARLFIEWLISPQRLALYETITGYGAAFPESGTRMAKYLEGLDIVYRTEDVELKAIEMGLSDRFAKILGVTLQ